MLFTRSFRTAPELISYVVKNHLVSKIITIYENRQYELQVWFRCSTFKYKKITGEE